MSVKTTVFGAVRLSGEDAQTFKKQVKNGRSTQAARATLERGSKLLSEYQKHGCVTVRAKKR